MVTHTRERLLSTGPSHVIRGHDRVIVRAWHEQALGAVRYRIDEEAWAELETLGDGHWSGPLAGERLSKGEHVLDVIAIGQDFAQGFQWVRFMVDSTGRDTSVPKVRPVVTSRAFC
jgi:Icc protein